MNVLWAIIWLLLLLFIGWPIAGFCAGFYVFCLPFEVCISPLKELNEFLYKGVKLPWEMAHRLKEGRAAIPPSSQPLQFNTPTFHGSSKSLNLLQGYKSTPQYLFQPAPHANSHRDVYNLTSYTTELDYSAVQMQQASKTRGSNQDLYSIQTPATVNESLFVLNRQNSIVSAHNPRHSTYSYVCTNT